MAAFTNNVQMTFTKYMSVLILVIYTPLAAYLNSVELALAVIGAVVAMATNHKYQERKASEISSEK